MMTFKVIETQEELDEIIKDRLKRQKESFDKELADLEQLKTRNSELETEVGTLQSTIEETKTATSQHDQTVSELKSKIAGYETANLRTKIAVQNGLPLDLADRLVGEDEDSLKADAERLSKFMKPKFTPPTKSTEPRQTGSDDPMKEMIQSMRQEGE
ncbi:capsid assembly scaffolding protein Gp46 family protein [Enterococcus sp. AZ128]|uniref:capsid assembly scaffolding protein Gp46 family protein n=1 Tax=unclassified Enterococcus TaxID=2608891 RepID=UPI003F684232